MSLEVRGQVDDVDGGERTFLWTDTTTDAQSLRDVGNLRLGRDFNAQFASTHDRAGFLAFLSTFLLGVSPPPLLT